MTPGCSQLGQTLLLRPKLPGNMRAQIGGLETFKCHHFYRRSFPLWQLCHSGVTSLFTLHHVCSHFGALMNQLKYFLGFSSLCFASIWDSWLTAWQTSTFRFSDFSGKLVGIHVPHVNQPVQQDNSGIGFFFFLARFTKWWLWSPRTGRLWKEGSGLLFISIGLATSSTIKAIYVWIVC